MENNEYLTNIMSNFIVIIKQFLNYVFSNTRWRENCKKFFKKIYGYLSNTYSVMINRIIIMSSDYNYLKITSVYIFFFKLYSQKVK